VILDQHTQYAGLARRLGAVLIDTLIITPPLVILLYWLYGPEYLHWNIENTEFFAVYGWADIPINYGLPFLLTVIFWVKLQGTPGKLLLNCHVVDAASGEPITVRQAVLRYVGYLVSALPLGLGFLWIIWDKRHQGFHDKIAGTVVVLGDESAKTLHELDRELR